MPGSLVVRHSGGRPGRVEAVRQGGATLTDLAGSCVAAPLASLAPDRCRPLVLPHRRREPGARDRWGGEWNQRELFCCGG